MEPTISFAATEDEIDMEEDIRLSDESDSESDTGEQAGAVTRPEYGKGDVEAAPSEAEEVGSAAGGGWAHAARQGGSRAKNMKKRTPRSRRDRRAKARASSSGRGKGTSKSSHGGNADGNWNSMGVAKKMAG